MDTGPNDNDDDDSSGCSPRPAAYRALLTILEIEVEVPTFDVAWYSEGLSYPIFDSLAGPLAKITPQLEELILVQFDPAEMDNVHNVVPEPNSVRISKLLGQIFNSIPHPDISLTSDQTSQEIELVINTTQMLRSARNLPSLELQAHHTLHCQLNQMESCRAKPYGIWSAHQDCIYILSDYLPEPAPVALPSLKDLWLVNVVCTGGEI